MEGDEIFGIGRDVAPIGPGATEPVNETGDVSGFSHCKRGF